jgi:hypothetical protein
MFDIYNCNKDDSCRFSLGTSGNKTIYIIGLNPSTANKEKSDKTVTMVENIAAKNNFDSFVMLNLFPLRSTNPHGLPINSGDILLKQNVEHIKSLNSKNKEMVIWAAWGGSILLRKYLLTSLEQINTELSGLFKEKIKWKNYGDLTIGGHPRHPSRASYSWAFQNFDVFDYLKNIKSRDEY